MFQIWCYIEIPTYQAWPCSTVIPHIRPDLSRSPTGSYHQTRETQPQAKEAGRGEYENLYTQLVSRSTGNIQGHSQNQRFIYLMEKWLGSLCIVVNIQTWTCVSFKKYLFQLQMLNICKKIFFYKKSFFQNIWEFQLENTALCYVEITNLWQW